ncbi:unnamed protein product [Triticum aestivum]|uniref:Uncharacterized protein n=1 Tax=Triticum aestivum TaxID=4565 RepID=A0A7H4LHB6_WHEAT|nr:unnamed protein product [Triticum aestivum]
MDKSRGSSSEALSGSKRAREASPGNGVDLAYEAELRSKLESERAVRERSREREDWEAGPERSVARSGTTLPGSGGAAGSGLDPWEAAVASAGGGSSSSAPRPAPARGPVPPPRPPPRSFVAGAASRSGPRFGPGSSSSQAGERRPPPSAPGAPSAIRGDGILPPPPPPPRQHPVSSGPSPTLTCFACHRPNHFQSRCTNPPFCLIFRSDGHLTVDCRNRTKSPSFIQFGLGLPRCSFFALDADVPVVMAAPSLSNAAIITVCGQMISPQTLLEGLKIWDNGGWDWQVRQLSEYEFAVVFPSKDCLRMISSCTSFTLPLNQLVVSVKAATCGAKAVGPLSKIWVLVDDLPVGLRSVEFMMAFGKLIGKPLEVDSESLGKVDPVRLNV